MTELASGFEAIILARAAMLALAASRIAGFVMAAPFPGNHVSASARTGLVCALSFVVMTFADGSAIPTRLEPRVVLAATSELGIGLVIGFTFRLVFVIADTVGQQLAQAAGLTTPTTLNPAIEAEDAALGRIVTLLAILIALSLGAHRTALAYLLESFRSLPLGSGVPLAGLATGMLDTFSAAIAHGVRLAFPAMAVGVVVQAALAVIARSAPSLQIFSVGLAVLAGTGVLVAIATLPDVASGIGAAMQTLPAHLDRCGAALGMHDE